MPIELLKPVTRHSSWTESFASDLQSFPFYTSAKQQLLVAKQQLASQGPEIEYIEDQFLKYNLHIYEVQERPSPMVRLFAQNACHEY